MTCNPAKSDLFNVVVKITLPLTNDDDTLKVALSNFCGEYES